jgi:energy-coupling factor transporter ATP-binding protein EcfA2
VRHSEQRKADRMRRTYELFFPSTMGPEQVLAFIRSLSGLPKPKFMQPIYAVSFERYADEAGERFFIHTPGRIAARLDELFYEHIEGSMEKIEDHDDPVATMKWQAGTELAMTSSSLFKSLRILDVQGTSHSMNAQFKSLNAGEASVLQWCIFPTRPRAAESADKEFLADHTFAAIARLGATGEYAQGMVKDLSSVFKAVEAPGARFTRRLMPNVGERINLRASTAGFPIHINAKEFSALCGWPLNGAGARRAKRIAPTVVHDSQGIVIGVSNTPKLQNRRVAIPEKALTVHSWLLGPSGTGKSTLLHNMATQVIDQNMGLVLIEPKGDLARDILSSIPLHRIHDLIWFDPLDVERPLPLNVLAGDDPERVTSHVVGMFKNLSGDTWSAQLQRVLRNAVMTAALNKLTLYDVKQLLVNKEYRSAQVRRLNRNIHPDIIQEWRWLDDKADLTVDSAVNRLDAFLGSRMIRNIVSQKNGLDFDEIVRKRKILLVPLSEAHMGSTNASALGQLIFDLVWDATLRRPPEHREPNVMMVDEFQMFCEMMNTTKADPFALARSYGLGLMVANQYADQLPKAVQQTLSKNAQSQIVFRLASDDAKSMQQTFAPLTHDDLANLPRYTVAAKLMSSSGNAPVVTLKTPPPPKATGAAQEAVKYSREKYGRPVMEVEADLLTRHSAPEPKKRPSIGTLT